MYRLATVFGLASVRPPHRVYRVRLEMLMMKPVWFRICEESLGKYYITMYYDNEYNHANGEDL